MGDRFWFCAWIRILVLTPILAGSSDTYDEELGFKRLNNDQILSQFRFVITSGSELGKVLFQFLSSSWTMFCDRRGQ